MRVNSGLCSKIYLLFHVRPLKINGLFLVQNFPKLNARAKTKQAGKNKAYNVHYCDQKVEIAPLFCFLVFARFAGKRTRAKDQKQTIYFKRPNT